MALVWKEEREKYRNMHKHGRKEILSMVFFLEDNLHSSMDYLTAQKKGEKEPISPLGCSL